MAKLLQSCNVSHSIVHNLHCNYLQSLSMRPTFCTIFSAEQEKQYSCHTIQSTIKANCLKKMHVKHWTTRCYLGGSMFRAYHSNRCSCFNNPHKPAPTTEMQRDHMKHIDWTTYFHKYIYQDQRQSLALL